MRVSEKTLKHMLRILLSAVFLVSGVAKIFGPAQYLKEVSRLSFLPAYLDVFIGYGFIIIELVIGFMLLIKYNRTVVILTGLITILFTLYLTYKLLINDSSDCGCFGNLFSRDNPSALTQDLVLLLIMVYIYE